MVKKDEYKGDCSMVFLNLSFSKSGIYMIRNKKSNKWYIGSSSCMISRIGVHVDHLKRGIHWNYLLQKDFDNNSKNFGVFDISILEIVKNSEELKKRESINIEKMLSFNPNSYNRLNIFKQKLKDLINNENIILILKEIKTGKFYSIQNKKTLKNLNNIENIYWVCDLPSILLIEKSDMDFHVDEKIMIET